MDLSRMLNQTMTVYRTDGYNPDGSPIVSAPFTVNCRWSETNEQFVTNSGAEVYVKAWISCLEELHQGDQVALGDYTSRTEPPEEAEELKRDSAIPNLSAEETMYIYFV